MLCVDLWLYTRLMLAYALRMSHVDLGVTHVVHELEGLCMSYADLGLILYIWSSADYVEWEVVCGFGLYACRMRTWSESECEERVLALYI